MSSRVEGSTKSGTARVARHLAGMMAALVGLSVFLVVMLGGSPLPNDHAVRTPAPGSRTLSRRAGSPTPGGALAIDPGPRGGTPGAGGAISGLTAAQAALFPVGLAQFEQVDQVVGLPQTQKSGLGPRFDAVSCDACHIFPARGGSSPAANPLFNDYQMDGATNTMPSFELPNGPVLVAHFPYQSDLVTPDGTVHQLFTVTGRTDAPGCNLAQPDFATAQSQGNLSLRQVLPMFGDGLVEIIQNADILANMNANTSQKQALGISGHPNVLSDGSVGRFGWKANFRSLLEFNAEAYQAEQGVTDEAFPNEMDETAGCVFNGVPEDHTIFGAKIKPKLYVGSPERFTLFTRFLGPPRPAHQTSADINGLAQFNAIGCALCHNPSFTTPQSAVAALSNVQAFLYSDLLVHHMGPCRADNIAPGTAKGDEFRTAPLWNVGQRLFFMHDGHTPDIVQAIEDHFCVGNSQYPASEANAVVNAFNALSQTNQQDIVDFLRSL